MPASEQKVWTVADVRRLRDEHERRAQVSKVRYVRYEVVDGELFMSPAPSPPHQHVSFLLQRRLYEFVFPPRFAIAYAAPADLDLDERTGVQPDVLVVPLVDGRQPQTFEEAAPPLLVVEILSPSTARLDRGRKRMRFQRAGIPEYWIVDVDARLVERWRPEDDRPEIVTETLTWHSAGVGAPLVMDLTALFGELGDGTIEPDAR